MLLSEILKDNPPRVHGNGFLQFDVGDRLSVPLARKSDARIHIWDTSLPRQYVDTSIHNHRFGFHSLILAGALINIDIVIEQLSQDVSDAEYWRGISYNMYEPVGRNAEDTMLVHVKRELHSQNYICDSKDGNSMILRPGDSYIVEPEEFHLSLHMGTTITFMKKTKITDVLPKIMCPANQIPDNEFDRYLASADIEEVEYVKQKVIEEYGHIEVPT